MEYNNFGAFVYKNDIRREDKEDVALFATDVETFGEDSSNIPHRCRLLHSLLQSSALKKVLTWETSIHHAILGDGDVRLLIHGDHIPELYIRDVAKIESVAIINAFVNEGDRFKFEYNGYKLYYSIIEDCDIPRYHVEFIEPSGDLWECDYGYAFGATNSEIN